MNFSLPSFKIARVAKSHTYSRTWEHLLCFLLVLKCVGPQPVINLALVLKIEKNFGYHDIHMYI